ncbi:MAG: PIG-L family deacetylase, partial [Anaerolineales bacterium]|nr:PIG-L family deacetylase [Anaerolineales bacterium]
IEIGCGALIHHIVKQRTDFLCVTLSENRKIPDLINVKDEHFRSMKVLGVPEEKIVFGPFITRVFPDARQEILEFFLKLRKDFKPDLIFTHSKQDIHQDHNTMTDESLRAFRGITVLGYDVVRSSYGFFPHFLVEVTEQDVNKKIEALAEYETYRDRYYFNAELTRSIMVRHGALAECPFAEGFDILRIVGKFGAN